MTKKEEMRIAGNQKEIHHEEAEQQKQKKTNAKLNSALETVKSRL